MCSSWCCCIQLLHACAIASQLTARGLPVGIHVRLQQGEDKLVEQLTVVCLRDCSHWANQDRCGGGAAAVLNQLLSAATAKLV